MPRGSEEVTEMAGLIREGEILGGKYRVDRVLGSGAMGVVLAARHLGLDARVAIKLLRPHMLEHEDAIARFAREAQAAARILSEHVARVLDVGTLEDGAPYIVMEFLEGIDLQQWVEERGPLPVDQAVDFLLQAGEAVAEAHAMGIVHRDLKPSNLFCANRPNGALCIKVLDFGISKVSATGSSGPSMSMTSTATLMGTPLYMSPEQMGSSRGVDARTDIWSLGIILFELLTGKVPFSGESLPEVCLKVTSHSPPPLRRFRTDVPADVEAALMRCLEKDRLNRWATVAELCSAIAPYGLERAVPSAGAVGQATLAADPSVFPSSRMDSPAQQSLRGVGFTGEWSPRRKTAVPITVAGAFVVVAAAAVLLLRQPKATSVAPPAGAASTSTPTVAPASPVPPVLTLAPMPPDEGTAKRFPAELTAVDPPAASAAKPTHRAAPTPLAGKVSSVSKVAPDAPHPVTASPSHPSEAARNASAYDDRQ